MIVVVCVKLVPDPDEPLVLDPVSGRLDRMGSLVLDEADTYGVEVALRLVTAAGSGEVVVVAMAPAEARTGLRTALAMGAHRGVLVSDPALAGSDALATAKVLAAAIRPIAPDLVIAATDSSDGATGTVPVQVAELLGLPAVTGVRQVVLDDGWSRLTRLTGDEVVCTLPAVITVTSGCVDPRYPGMRGVLQAKTKRIDTPTLDELGIDPAVVGSGSGQRVLAVHEAPPRPAGTVVADDGHGHERIVDYLVGIGVLR